MSESSLYTYRAHVRRVYDGDTITVDIDLGFSVVLREQSVRLKGINAPEMRGASSESAAAARDALRSKILDKWVILRTVKDSREKYGRWLGEIWIDGVCVNDWLIVEGHAVAYM